MSMESDLVALIAALCPRVYPDVAPAGAVLPYVTYQHIGGQPLRYVNGQAVGLRHSQIQVNTWAATRAESLSLCRAIEDAISSATVFSGKPDSEPIGDVDGDSDRRGCMQDFSIWSPR